MRRSICSLLLFHCLPVVLFAQRDSVSFDNLLFTALQGKMTTVLAALDTMEASTLKPSQQRLKEKYLHRFRAQDEQQTFPTSDRDIVAIITIYRRYWRNALMDPEHLGLHDSLLGEAVAAHLRAHDPGLARKGQGHVVKHWNSLLQQHLEAHGCFAAIGRTGALYDLLLHGRETEVDYPVRTTEDSLDVKVIFMDSVLSNGWEGYATFDTYFPGGWATKQALYCDRATYDLSSEQFKVSYLKHEGQHFADYKHFPKLKGPDLEYRAKLVELASADKTLYGLIGFFLSNISYDPEDPHAYANFCVMRDLSMTLFNSERQEDMGAWRKLPPSAVHEASATLLRLNTKGLEEAGARKVDRFVR
jgi:hypothetical protein